MPKAFRSQFDNDSTYMTKHNTEAFNYMCVLTPKVRLNYGQNKSRQASGFRSSTRSNETEAYHYF